MQSGFTAHVTRAEWSWVIFIAVALVLLAFAPYTLLAMSSVAGSEWQFMGVLHNSRDGATYLSKMMLGVNQQWLVQFQHTSEPHQGAFLQIIYPALGQLSRLAGTPPILIFHIIRAIGAVFMYMALYQLAATIWMRIRTRRIFFVLVSVGAGFGWLYALMSGGQIDAPDLSIPEAFPLHSTFVNVHFPLTIGFLALLVSVVLGAFRPGTDAEPTIGNGGLTAVLLSLFLALLYPQAIVPIGLALVAYIALLWLASRQFPHREIRWLLTIALPALPFAVYYGAVIVYNPAMAVWGQQNITEAPPPGVLLIGFGLPLLIAVPGIVRAVRQFFGAYDDRFMLIWLVAMVIMIYMPTNIQRRFAVGMMLPVAYFATRAIEAYWFEHIVSRKWRYRLLVLMLPVMVLTQVFVLFLPVLPILANRPQDTQGLFLQYDYIPTFYWVDEVTSQSDVVLAAPVVSQWLPGWAGSRVVYGHPFETLHAATKEQQVLDWYAGECDAVLEQYDVDYVLYGPQEALLGDVSPCLSDLREVARVGDVTVYAP